MDDDISNSVEYMRAVAALRALPPSYQLLAVRAAMFWTNAQFVERACSVALPDDEIRGTIQ